MSLFLRAHFMLNAGNGLFSFTLSLSKVSPDIGATGNYLKRVLYFSYPSFSRSSLGMNLSAAEFMQYLSPVGFGPSLKTCPRWESACLLRTSVLLMNNPLSSLSTILSGSSGFVKLGQPVPESYLSRELKRGSPETMSTYIPSILLSAYSFLNAGSVPFFWVTSY